MKKAYMNPYFAGIGLGVFLLLSFLIAGRGIGASGAINQTLAHTSKVVAAENTYFSESITNEHLFDTWIIIEVLGILIGAYFSAKKFGRYKKELIKGSNTTNKRRIIFSILGGMLMGFGARLARGCTSGQALSGGALLNIGSWGFLISVFIGAYTMVYFMKKEWV
jgi:uncharacterized membrane protein YedE/YeeE